MVRTISCVVAVMGMAASETGQVKGSGKVPERLSGMPVLVTPAVDTAMVASVDTDWIRMPRVGMLPVKIQPPQ